MSHPQGTRDENSIQVFDSHSILHCSLSWATSEYLNFQSTHAGYQKTEMCTKAHFKL